MEDFAFPARLCQLRPKMAIRRQSVNLGPRRTNCSKNLHSCLRKQSISTEHGENGEDNDSPYEEAGQLKLGAL